MASSDSITVQCCLRATCCFLFIKSLKIHFYITMKVNTFFIDDYIDSDYDNDYDYMLKICANGTFSNM